MPSDPFHLKPVSPRALVAKLRPREAGAAPYATGPLQPPPRSPIAKFLFVVFLVLFAAVLLIGVLGAKAIGRK
jgi:hypothetical protein